MHATKARHEQKRKVTVPVTGFIAFLDRASRYPVNLQLVPVRWLKIDEELRSRILEETFEGEYGPIFTGSGSPASPCFRDIFNRVKGREGDD